jgi:hypothetical protein
MITARRATAKTMTRIGASARRGGRERDLRINGGAIFIESNIGLPIFGAN